ncbi:MAG TPA: DUF4175 family protein [Saprospiraceae bacterium]|nr:DUF4175 family protein [Saprospiraceae bacterium]
MTNSSSNYEQLIQKLDDFIRKYYVNQLIRGFLYTIGIVFAFFILINVLEYFFYFGKSMRKFLFFSFVGTSLLSMVYWIIIPGMKYFNLGKVIGHEQAAKIIGEHFSDVQDKLINILQLKNHAGAMVDDDLVLASINQKSEKIKLLPFKKAIDLRKNRKYLRYSLPPLLLLLALLFGAPSIIKDSTKRLVDNNTNYTRPAPFHFHVLNKNLEAVQFEDFDLEVGIEGDVVPNEVFIDLDGIQYRLKKDSLGHFSYQFHNLQKDQEFKLFSGRVASDKQHLKVLKKPNILEFDVLLDYPAYTGRKDEKLTNMGDLSVPEGTFVKWSFLADNTDEIQVKFGAMDSMASAKRQGNRNFYFSRKLRKDDFYKLYVSNSQLPLADSVEYRVSVIPDLAPVISLKVFPDSTNKDLIYLTGDASDDYGLTRLTFNYSIKSENGQKSPEVKKSIVDPSGKNAVYDYVLDVNTFDLKPGDELEYYFEVFDNDRVNGAKSARTNLMVFHKATTEELKKQESTNNEDIKKTLKDAMKNSQQMRDEMKKIREKLLDQKEMDWQEKKNLEKLLDKQKELQKEIQEAKEKLDENIKNQNELSKPDEQLLQKQEKLQKLFEETMSDDMKELMQQIEELLQELDKEEAIEKMEDYELSNEELEKEMDRMEELFKQLEVEKMMEDQIKELEELAKKQEDLAEKTEKEEKPSDELQKEQEELNKKMDEFEKKQKEMEKKNKELERPMQMEKQDDEMDDIQKDMENSQEQLQQKDNQGASQKQKSAAQKMKKMANKMSASMAAGQAAQNTEDMETLRQILENLVTLSYDQEDLKNEFEQVSTNTPHYTKLVENQYKLKDDFKIVEDSLRALAKRNEQIESFVMDKVSDIKKGIRTSLSQLEERQVTVAEQNQHETMKNLNDLALMLSEAMEQMQQQMASSMPGNQACQKPGQGKGKDGKVPMDKIGKGQKGLNEQMKKMRDQLKKGGKGGSSKEFAKMAAKQAALREALRKIEQEKEGQGKGDKALQELIQKMDEVETKLVNKQLDNELLKRQADILTRLLEAEKAERKRKKDNKRKSKSAEQIKHSIPPSLEEYIKKRKAEVESFKTVSPALRPYYKILVEEYINELKQ